LLAILAFYRVAHSIAISKEPHTVAEQLILPAAVVMVNPIMIDESAGFSALALMKSKYCSKLNVEKEISSLIAQFEKMCGNQQIPQIGLIGCRLFAKRTFYNLTRGALGKSGFSKGAAIRKSLGTTAIDPTYILYILYILYYTLVWSQNTKVSESFSPTFHCVIVAIESFW